MDIQIIDLEIQEVPTKKDPTKCWEKAVVTFRDLDDNKVKAQNVVSFKLPPLFRKVSKLVKGDQVTVETELGDSGYLEWTSISKTGEVGPVKTKDAGQMTTIRQSSLSSAVQLLGTGASVKAVLDLAERFNHYILTGEETVKTEPEVDPDRDEAFIDMTDDIPF